MPRSGTSWIGQIFDSHPNTCYRFAPLFSYTFKNFISEESSRNDWLKFFMLVYNKHGHPFLEQIDKKRSGDYPDFPHKNIKPGYLVMKHTRFHNLTANLLINVPEVKLVHIVRNPCGAIYSWITSRKEFPVEADPMLEWKTGNCRKPDNTEFWGFDDWKLLTETYLQYQADLPEKVKVVSYDELVANTFELTKEIFSFVGLDISRQTEQFLVESHARHEDDEHAVFKDKSVKDRWRGKLDPEIQRAIYHELSNSPLSIFLEGNEQ